MILWLRYSSFWAVIRNLILGHCLLVERYWSLSDIWRFWIIFHRTLRFRSIWRWHTREYTSYYWGDQTICYTTIFWLPRYRHGIRCVASSFPPASRYAAELEATERFLREDLLFIFFWQIGDMLSTDISPRQYKFSRFIFWYARLRFTRNAFLPAPFFIKRPGSAQPENCTMLRMMIDIWAAGVDA